MYLLRRLLPGDFFSAGIHKLAKTLLHINVMPPKARDYVFSEDESDVEQAREEWATYELGFGKYKGTNLETMLLRGKTRHYLRYLLKWDDIRPETESAIKEALRTYAGIKKARARGNKQQVRRKNKTETQQQQEKEEEDDPPPPYSATEDSSPPSKPPKLRRTDTAVGDGVFN